MDTFDQIIGGFGKIYELITANTWAATISVVGFAFLVIAIPACARAIKDDNPSFFLKTLVFFSLIGGMVFAGTGPSIALFGVAQGPILKVPATKAFDNLKENAVVHWLIRLIPFDPQADPQLAVGKLSAVGAKEQRYTFVAPYEELRGYSVEQAVRNTGGTYHPGYHVSAIIFQVANNTIYPANARGLLQVVSEVEKNIDSESEGKFLLKQGGGLDASDREDLNHLEIYSWRWDNYKQRYPQYCQLAHEFRCERSYMARSQIGGLYKDWHPFGLSQREQRNPCDLTAQNFCSKSDWDEQRKELLSHFGSRAFFVRNHPLTEIGDRYLIEFGDPSNQVIPDIGFRAPVREAAQ